MKLRTTLGALVVAAALALGVAAPALAEEPADPPTRACVAARVATLRARVADHCAPADAPTS